MVLSLVEHGKGAKYIIAIYDIFFFLGGVCFTEYINTINTVIMSTNSKKEEKGRKKEKEKRILPNPLWSIPHYVKYTMPEMFYMEVPRYILVCTLDSRHKGPGSKSNPTIARYFCPLARHFIHIAGLDPGVQMVSHEFPKLHKCPFYSH